MWNKYKSGKNIENSFFIKKSYIQKISLLILLIILYIKY